MGPFPAISPRKTAFFAGFPSQNTPVLLISPSVIVHFRTCSSPWMRRIFLSADRYVDMPDERSAFAEILETLLSKRENTSISEGNSQFPNAADTQVAWWSLLNPPPAIPLAVPRSKTAYVRCRPKAPPTPRVPRPSEPYIALDRLSPEAIEAAKSFFQLAGQPLPSSVQLSTVRRMYHRLAKALHPDTTRNADGRQFRELAEIYSHLQKSLKSALAEGAKPV